MKTPTLVKIILAAASLPWFTGCTSERPVAVAPQVAPVTGAYVGQPTQPPPPDQKDIVPVCPGSRTTWWFIPGYWEWRGQWVWVPGHWRTRPHPGDIWIPGKWLEQTNTMQQTNVFVWQSGHWRSGAHDDRESVDQ
jgi:hypothetical protein